jgi:hypothetical protein
MVDDEIYIGLLTLVICVFIYILHCIRHTGKGLEIQQFPFVQICYLAREGLGHLY